MEDEYAGKAANDVVGSLSALLKDSPRVNPRKAAPLEAFASVPQAGLPRLLLTLVNLLGVNTYGISLMLLHPNHLKMSDQLEVFCLVKSSQIASGGW